MCYLQIKSRLLHKIFIVKIIRCIADMTALCLHFELCESQFLSPKKTTNWFDPINLVYKPLMSHLRLISIYVTIHMTFSSFANQLYI